VLTFDNSAFASVPNPYYSCAAGANHSGTLWFQFTATATSARLFSCASVMIDSTFAVYAGTCGSLVEIGCSEDDFACTDPFLGDICIGGLVPGNTYYVQFSAWSAADRGQYTLEMRCPCTCGDGVADPPDEECDGVDAAACPGQCLADCTCPAGCNNDADCEDADVCTRDECVALACQYLTNKYGDIDGNGFITLADLFCVLDGFGGDFTNCSFEQDDIHGTGSPIACVPPAVSPCCPNGAITLGDLFAVLDAFGGEDACCGG